MPNELVVLTDTDLPGDVVRRALAAAGHRVVEAASPAASDIAAAAAGAEALVVQWAPITAELMDRLPSLRFISRLGIGYDMIDVEAASERGIRVANTPGYCTEEVAAHTLAMIMALARGLPAYDRSVRSGAWSAVAARPFAARPSTTTIGVIGYGRIGSLVARHCAAIGFRVVVHDPAVPDGRIRLDGHVPATLDEAIADAHVLTLHAPLTEDTRHLLDARALDLMRDGAAVVNTCRGPLIDHEALADALESGSIGAAALDVFPEEPLPATSRLRSIDGVLLTPHAAWYSPEALADLPVHAARNVVDFFARGDESAVVNRVR